MKHAHYKKILKGVSTKFFIKKIFALYLNWVKLLITTYFIL